jgi:hypothetical protein
MPKLNPFPVALAFVVAASLMEIRAGADEDDAPAARTATPVRRDAPYHAYSLTAAKGESEGGYGRLLVTRGPLESLAGHARWSPLPFDNMAMTFETYGKDSLWDHPFATVKKIGGVDPEAHSVEIDGFLWKYEDWPLKDVIRLFENPLGTKPLHRRVHPLKSAEQTSRAFVLLLQEQLKQTEPVEPTRRALKPGVDDKNSR